MPIDPGAELEITAYNWVPPFAVGLVRDLRVRWAAEEMGLPYRENLISVMAKPDGYGAQQPFLQVPAIRDGKIAMFESGAILLHLAEKTGKLLPAAGQARADVLTWLFAALNSVEPAQDPITVIDGFYAQEDWAKARRPAVLKNLNRRYGELAAAIGGREWAAGEFSIADIAMVTVLRTCDALGLLAGHPVLAAYVARATARPAYQQALADQLAGFDDANAPKRENG